MNAAAIHIIKAPTNILPNESDDTTGIAPRAHNDRTAHARLPPVENTDNT
ncbi:hypothetical protein [Pseudonocardia acaciae]|nr:hypothetical protein [Pseudonocardia acaciae]